MDQNIIIIGGGPIGCYLGYLLRKEGFLVDIYEEKKEIGIPMQCTGIVTKSIHNVVNLPKNLIINEVKNVKVIVGDESIEIENDDIIIDRIRFDKYFESLAKDVGVDIHYNHKLTDIYYKNNDGKKDVEIIIHNTKDKKVLSPQFSVLIGADGPMSKVSSLLNPKIKNEFYKGVQVRARGDIDSSIYQTFFGKVCPDFFGWIVPENDTISRIGLASRENPNLLFEKFLDVLPEDIIERNGGLIPIYNPRKKIFKKIGMKKIFTVGDAAGMVKATTGGGIVQGLSAAQSLTKSIRYNKNYISETKKLMRDLKASLYIRKILNKMDDDDYIELLKIMKEDETQKLLSEVSRDNPIRLGLKLIKTKPTILKFLKLLFK